MESLNSVLREIFAWLLNPWAGRPILWSLILTSALAAVVAVVVFESLSNKAAREQAWRQLWANLLAIRLFADEPRIVAQSLAGVAAANARLLACGILPLAVLAPIFLLVYGHLDAFFGSAPLAVGVPRVLTVRLNRLESGWPDIRIETPAWVTVDSPPVHVLDEKEISWSIRATQAARGVVKIVAAADVIEKTIDSRPGPRYFSLARRQSLAGALRYPAENRLPPGSIAEVNILEPERAISCCGIALAWTWWFAVFSALLALPAKWSLSRPAVLYRRIL